MRKITDEQFDKILRYLASKPYAEVAQLIQEISQAEKIDDGEPDNKSK